MTRGVKAQRGKAPTEKPRRGRPPVVYVPEVVDEILRRLAEGEGLRTICESIDGGPSCGTVIGWYLRDEPPGFAGRYARAREAQAEGLADEIVKIGDTDPDPQRARVRIDARKWVAAKLLPKKYGERMDVTSGGEKLPAQVIVMVPDNDRGDRNGD